MCLPLADAYVRACVRALLLDDHQAMHLTLEFVGFCPWTVVNRDAMLLPGNPANLVRYKKKFYAMVDEEAVQAFMQAPDKYITGVLANARKSPELIHLLRLQDHFPATSITDIMSQTSGKAADSQGHPMLAADVAHYEVETQTPTHFVEKHMDVNYEWNEWGLRRRALQLTNLRKKATKSQQTLGSHFRREAETQVYLPADSTTQTKVTTGTSAVVTRNYIAGLRGDPAQRMDVVNLTIDPEISIGQKVHNPYL